jgi:15-cis-phytoene synthase
VAPDREGSAAGKASANGAIDGASQRAGAEVAAIARAGQPDRYLAALLAPVPEREALLALAAFAAELARIPQRVVREPIMGELRLEWWRKAVAAPDSAPGSDVDTGGHSVAEAMRAAVARHGLPCALLDSMINARALELMPAPFADDAAQRDFLWRTEGVPFLLASRVLGLGPHAELEAAARAAGHAYGLTQLLMGLPRSLSHGRVTLALTQVAAAGLSAHELLAGAGGDGAGALLKAHFAQIRGSLAEARRLARNLPQRTRVAFLPLALVEAYVRRLERQGVGALREEIQILPLTRVWGGAAGAVRRAARRG